MPLDTAGFDLKKTIGPNQDGRLEVYVIGSDGNLWHNFQTALNGGPNGQAWYGWVSKGGTLLEFPVVGRNPDGRLEVFAGQIHPGHYELAHIWQTAPNGHWSGWASLGGNLSSPGDWVVASNLDGRLVVVAVNHDVDPSKFSQISQIAPSSGDWNPWQLVGVPSEIAWVVGRNADGRLELFSMGDVSLCNLYQVAPNGTQWSWQSISVPDANWRVYPTVVRDNAGALNVFITNGPQNQIYTMSQIAPGGAWSGWQLIVPYSINISLTAAQYSDGAIALFQVTPGGDLRTMIQTGGGTWSPWKSLGGQLALNPSVVAIAQNQDGHLEAFAFGHDNTIWHAFETDQVHHTWSGWSSLGAP